MGSGNSRELLDLAKAGNEAGALEYLRNSYFLNPEYSNSDGNTALHFAAHHGFVKLAKALIEKGAKVNAMNRVRSSPLHIAVRYNRPDVVQLLLENLADPNQLGQFSHSALTLAATQNCYDIAKILIEAGAQTQPMTLQLAAMNKDGARMTKLLVDNGAEPNSADEQGNTALMTAAVYGNEEVVQTLLKLCPQTIQINKTNKKGWTALHFACNDYDPARRKRIVQLIVSHGGDLLIEDNNGLKPNEVRPKRKRRDQRGSNRPFKKPRLADEDPDAIQPKAVVG